MNTVVTVKDAMVREYVGVSESDSAMETAKLLLDEGGGCAVVLRGHEAVGLICERDLLAALVERGGLEELSAADVMVAPVPTIDARASLDAAADALAAGDTHRLVVVDDGEPVGVLSEHDLVTAGAFAPGREEYDEARIQSERARAAPVAEAVSDTEGELAMEDGGVEDEAISSQSVCEACGALSRGLAGVQGQLLCPDCRDV